MIPTGIVFNALVPVWLIFMVSICAGLFFIWKEVRRKHRFLIVRIAAQTIALIGATGIALHPGFRRKQGASAILLLTKNYEARIVDSLRSNNPEVELVSAPDAAAFRSARKTGDWNELSSIDHRIRFVVGEGIPVAALDLMSEKNYQFFPAITGAGTLSLRVDKFYANRVNILQGTYRTKKNEPITLLLAGPEGVEDSVRLEGNRTGAFSLKFNPKLSGRFLFQLSGIGGKDSLSESLPLEILPERTLNVLVVQQYPTAEIRYLKNYLADHHHRVVLRYRVSLNQFRYEYANTAGVSVDVLNKGRLGSFDLLIMDNESMDRLQPGEKSSLEQSIRAGLGVIVTGAKSPSLFPAVRYGKTPADTTSIHLVSEDKNVLPLLSPDSPLVDLEDIITPDHNRHLAGFIYFGEGKIGYCLVQETYSLQLKGQSEVYAKLWTTMIERVSRRQNDRFKITMDEFPHRASDPVSFEVISSGFVPNVLLDGIHVPLKEDEHIDDVWHGKVWASRIGWHSLSIPDDTTDCHFYVSGKDEWQTLSLENQLKLNSIYHNGAENSIGTSSDVVDEIPPLLFFVLFLLGAGFSWLLPKL